MEEGDISKACNSRLPHGDDYTPLSNCRRQHTIQHHKARRKTAYQGRLMELEWHMERRWGRCSQGLF